METFPLYWQHNHKQILHTKYSALPLEDQFTIDYLDDELDNKKPPFYSILLKWNSDRANVLKHIGKFKSCICPYHAHSELLLNKLI